MPRTYSSRKTFSSIAQPSRKLYPVTFIFIQLLSLTLLLSFSSIYPCSHLSLSSRAVLSGPQPILKTLPQVTCPFFRHLRHPCHLLLSVHSSMVINQVPRFSSVSLNPIVMKHPPILFLMTKKILLE